MKSRLVAYGRIQKGRFEWSLMVVLDERLGQGAKEESQRKPWRGSPRFPAGSAKY